VPRTIFDKKPRFIKLLDLINGRAKTEGKSFTDLGAMLGGYAWVRSADGSN